METDNSSRQLLLPRWEWRYVPDQATPQETKWQAYELEENYLIERAYFRQQREITLEDNVLSFERMERFDGKRKVEVRRIERETLTSREEKTRQASREERFAITEMPKTFNNAFGSITDFLNFFENRDPEIKTFADAFRQIEESNDFEKLNTTILPLLISSIQKESGLDQKEKEQELTNPFKRSFTSFKDFYGQIFKAYTVDGFLYRNLNRYLRNEDWTSLDNLLPYAFCLCKGFLCSDILAFCNDNNTPQPQELVLYRGTTLDKMALELYNPNLTENFSWNSVTSTSTSQRVATNFMIANAERELSKVPVMFVISIPTTTTMSPEQSAPNFLRIKPFSAYPAEEEIILPPGSIFQIENLSIDKQERAIIRLRLITDVEKLAHKGQIMHGAMQKEMMIGTEAKIMCLENNNLKEALVSLSGNQLVKEIEFCLCKFSFQTVQTIIESLPTIKNLEKLSLISCSAESSDLMGSLFKHLQTLSIKTLHIAEINFLDQIHCAFKEGIRYWNSLKSLTLNFTQSKVLSKEWLSEFCTQGLRHLTLLTVLNMNFSYCESIRGEELAILASKGLVHLIHLTSLTLNFDNCKRIRDQGISSLSSALKSLAHLDLNFSLNERISDQGIFSLCSQGLQHCKDLTSLTLSLSWLSKLSDEAIDYFCIEALHHLPNLTHLNIDLTCCSDLTEVVVSSLAVNGLKFLPKLLSLTLSLKDRRDLTDETLAILAAEGLKNLTSLTYLDLNFSTCGEITDEGISSFAREGLSNLTALKSFKLNFAECLQIRNDFIETLCSEGLKLLANLTSLALNFSGCFFVGDQGIRNLCFSGLENLPSLTSLDLNFAICKRITDEGIDVLCTEGLKALPVLKTVNLNFQHCAEISKVGAYQLQDLSQKYKTSIALGEPHSGHDPSKLFIYKRASEDLHEEIGHKDIHPKLNYLWKQISQQSDSEDSLCAFNLQIKESFENLTSLTMDTAWGPNLTDDQILAVFIHGLQSLKHLTSLYLDFKNSRHITDQTLINLASQGLENLDNLTSLALIFDTDTGITDAGVSFLCKERLRYLTQLQSLTLSFQTCRKLTDQGIAEIASNCLQHLTQLTSLNLGLRALKAMTTQGVSDLCSQGLRFLSNLISLTIDFLFSENINNECFEKITQVLCHVPLLENLDLRFSSCTKISDKGLSQFSSQGLSLLTKLKSFHLSLNNCSKIGSAGVSDLFLHGLKNLLNLQSLDLDLTCCLGISDEALIFLGKNGLKYLKNLMHLNIDFSGCQLISNEGIIIFASEGLRDIHFLQYLSLAFQNCEKITDEGLNMLCSQGFKNLTFLSSLRLDFGYCPGITDEGINNLCFHGLKKLNELRELEFNFSQCPQVTEIAAINLRKVLKYYGFKGEKEIY